MRGRLLFVSLLEFSCASEPAASPVSTGFGSTGLGPTGLGSTSGAQSTSDSQGTVNTTGALDGSTGGPTFDVGVGTGTDAGDLGCSGDLQRVIDAEGALVQTCPPDQGCHDGQCVQACMAAAQSEGSIGCDYLAPYPPFYQNEVAGTTPFDGACHALMIANTWGRPAQLTLERDGVVYDALQHARVPNGIGPTATYDLVPATGIPVGQVAILFLSHVPTAQHPVGASLACPAQPAYVGDAAVHGTGQGIAFALTSDTPVTVYDIVPFGGAESYLPSASLLFPTSAWGENYVVAGPHSASSGPAKWTLVVARDDGTMVTINTDAAIMAGGVAAPAPGVATAYPLDAGEYVQFASTDEFAGDIIESTGQVGVYTGHTYLTVPTADSGGGPQDSSHQQIVDVRALGYEYVGAGIPTRLASRANESVMYRIVGVVDGTVLTFNAAAPAGAPTALNLGDAVEFETVDPFVVSSQGKEHPFAFTQYMSGSISPSAALDGCFGGPCALGDTDWINLVPPAQFLSRYAFFIDPTYGVASVALTRTAGPDGFADVNIACMGEVTGWMPVGNSTEHEVAHVDLHRAGVGACATSQQEASSALPFGLTVWGTDRDASYGYPAGGNVRVINEVAVPAG